MRQWCLEVPEIVNVSVNTPYPGTEIWSERAGDVVSRDYRLYDIQHAVLPTRLPLDRFYAELVKTQQVMNRKHLGFAGSEKRIRHRAQARAARPDQLHQDAVEVQQRL